VKERDHLEVLSIRWDNNVIMDLEDIGLESLDDIGLLQDTDEWQILINTVMNLRVS
jgi:hypothetical protein